MLRRFFEGVSLLGSIWRKFLIRLHSPDISFGRGVRVERGAMMRTLDGGKIAIGPGTHVWPYSVIEARGGRIEIGAESLVNVGCYIVSTDEIVIGRDALIAEYVTIRDQDHAHDDTGIAYSRQGRVQAPIRIGDNVWLGAKVTVTKGVEIGEGAIIGSNAVVTRDVPAFGRYGGVPARPLASRR